MRITFVPSAEREATLKRRMQLIRLGYPSAKSRQTQHHYVPCRAYTCDSGVENMATVDFVSGFARAGAKSTQGEVPRSRGGAKLSGACVHSRSLRYQTASMSSTIRITMCLAAPARVISISDRVATVDFGSGAA